MHQQGVCDGYARRRVVSGGLRARKRTTMRLKQLHPDVRRLGDLGERLYAVPGPVQRWRMHGLVRAWSGPPVLRDHTADVQCIRDGCPRIRYEGYVRRSMHAGHAAVHRPK